MQDAKHDIFAPPQVRDYQLQQDTPRAGERNFTPAGFWVRLVAFVVDALIISIISTTIMMAIYGLEYWDPEHSAGWIPEILLNWLWPFFFTILFWFQLAATPGKILMGTVIVRLSDGSTPSRGRFVGRYFAYILSYITIFIGFIMVGCTKHKQGLHDLLCDTTVVYKKSLGQGTRRRRRRRRPARPADDREGGLNGRDDEDEDNLYRRSQE